MELTPRESQLGSLSLLVPREKSPPSRLEHYECGRGSLTLGQQEASSWAMSDCTSAAPCGPGHPGITGAVSSAGSCGSPLCGSLARQLYGRTTRAQSPSLRTARAPRSLAAWGRQRHLELCCPLDTALSSPTAVLFHNWGWGRSVSATGFCWLGFLALKLTVTSRVKTITISSGPWDPTQNLDGAGGSLSVWQS